MTAGTPGQGELVVAADGKTEAIIVVSPNAKKPMGLLSGETYATAQTMIFYERAAADELVRCITLMTGATPTIADTPEAISAALKEKTRPVLIVGSEALKAEKRLSTALKKVAKARPMLRADAIVVKRDRNRVYLAGLTDDGHYHAVVELLERWGCRWYVPTEFGECIPEQSRLAVGTLNYAYASPFELRIYWIAWNGDTRGYTEFLLHNRMTRGVVPPPAGHALGSYVKELIPPGKTLYEIPIAEDKTADHVTAKLDALFRDNGMASVAIEDGLYTSESKLDNELQAGLHDKYFYGMPIMSDPFLTLYNKVCDRLLLKYPQSSAKLGFLIYSNMTVPPQRIEKAAKPLFASLAPIDIDPNHGMDDFRSPPRQEYRDMMYRWAQVMDGRMYVRDYDQGALVWRDIPNPSHQAFRRDVRHYAKAGLAGFNVESRNATATTFLNHYLRGQLMWNPKTDVDARLAEFYPTFYGPAAEPMSRYWGAIYRAWEQTIVTEHEFFMIPAIYTPALIEELRGHLAAAEMAVLPLKTNKIVLTRNEQLYLDRMRFTRMSFDVLDGYTGMLAAGAGECDYAKAAACGQRALAARTEMQKMNGTFVNTRMGENGPAWFPSEVQLYADLGKLTSGPDGKLVSLLPLEWAFRRDPNDTGLASGFAYRAPSLDYWNANKGRFTTPESRKDYPTTQWEMLRTDQYMQAQGVLHPDWQSFTGFAWYHTTATLNAADAAANVHLRFPGLFGESWLYVNGHLVAHWEQAPMWWYNDYAFTWDVPLAGALKEGENTIVLRNHVQHHVGGMFRRPFLYAPVVK
ncbi:MAG: DUF4838 domain-containing protein [Armatimonadota bacterium]